MDSVIIVAVGIAIMMAAFLFVDATSEYPNKKVVAVEVVILALALIVAAGAFLI